MRKSAGSTAHLEQVVARCRRSASRGWSASDGAVSSPVAIKELSTPSREPNRLYTVILETPARRAIPATVTSVLGLSWTSCRAAVRIERAVASTAGWRLPRRYGRVT